MPAQANLSTDDIRATVRAQKPGHSLDTALYAHQDFHEVDIEKIWARNWIYAGHVSQIPNAGDYFTYDIGKDPLILMRGDNGEVRALANVCQHRGSRIVDSGAGNTKRLVCPYHQWVYGRDGELLSAKHLAVDFPREEYGLPQINCRTLTGGFIFVCLANDPPPFDDFASQVAPHLALYNLENAKVGAAAEYTLKSNWKLMDENFRECYHCGVGHPEYCKIITGANMAGDNKRANAHKDEQRALWKAAGVPTHMVDFGLGIHRYCERYPYEPGCVTMSLDGQPVAPSLSERVAGKNVGAFSIVQYPNFWLDVNNDYAWTMRITALDADHSHVSLQWIVNGDAVEGRDFDRERLMAFWKTTGEQDWKLCEDTQAGVSSRFYRPFPYAPVENGPGQFIEWYLMQLTA